MPEISLCRNCAACADPTAAELQLIQDARMWKLQQRNADDLFAVDLHRAVIRRAAWKKHVASLGAGTKKLSQQN